jgi:hypothetical protein
MATIRRNRYDRLYIGKEILYIICAFLGTRIYIINYNHKAKFLLRASSYTRGISHVGQGICELSTLFTER